jgi:hypothetical protein
VITARLTAAMGLLLLALPDTAAARGLALRGDTLVSVSGSRPELGAADTRSGVLLLELVRLHTEDLGVRGLTVEVSGLAGVHVGEAPLVDPAAEGDRALGQLIVGLVRWRSQDGALDLTLGRQYLFFGGGRAEHLDGGAVTYRTPWHVDLTLYGGRTSPWQLDYAPDQGAPAPDNEAWAWSNFAAGGRARVRLLEHAVASVGFIREWNDADVVRQLVSLDLGWWRFNVIEVQAGGIMDAVHGAPQELWLQLTSRPGAKLKLGVDYSYMVPALTIPKTSIFSVFALDAYHDLSAGAFYGLTDWLLAGLEGSLRLFPDDDAGDELRAGFSTALTLRAALGQGSTGLRLELLDSSAERLLQARLHARYRFPRGIYASAEAFLLALCLDGAQGTGGSIFRQRLEDNALSFGGVGLIGYSINARLSAQLQGSAFATPRAQRDLRLLARLTYAGDWGMGR